MQRLTQAEMRYLERTYVNHSMIVYMIETMPLHIAFNCAYKYIALFREDYDILSDVFDNVLERNQ